MIKQLTPADIDNFKAMLQVFENVFEMTGFNTPADAHLKDLLSQPNFLVFVAIHRGQMIGGLTAHILPSYYRTAPSVYIYDLAIKTEHQRKGFGKMLLEAVRSHARNSGYADVFVQAEGADTHALDFYRATGGEAQQVVHFTYNINS
ncbi:MAG: GNAT family N-acetyltransferase [Sphingobacteriales bacterium]|nr:MAG: GNAT family N-acetyltransferase [Sphingobacteriales bacterium]